MRNHVWLHVIAGYMDGFPVDGDVCEAKDVLHGIRQFFSDTIARNQGDRVSTAILRPCEINGNLVVG